MSKLELQMCTDEITIVGRIFFLIFAYGSANVMYLAIIYVLMLYFKEYKYLYSITCNVYCSNL